MSCFWGEWFGPWASCYSLGPMFLNFQNDIMLVSWDVISIGLLCYKGRQFITVHVVCYMFMGMYFVSRGNPHNPQTLIHLEQWWFYSTFFSHFHSCTCKMILWLFKNEHGLPFRDPSLIMEASLFTICKQQNCHYSSLNLSEMIMILYFM